MQRITPTSLTPEQYAQEQYHRQVQAPESCPNCQQLHCLEALGYYSRYVTEAVTAVLEIWIRRFLCRRCRISVSCLPQFAQPYRLVNSATVQAGFQAQSTGSAVRRWATLIAAYWRCFERHLPKLLQRVGQSYGGVPLQATAWDWWRCLLQSCQSLATATVDLVHRFGTCLFGTYRCHQRKFSRAG